MALGPIPWTAVGQFANAFGFTETQLYKLSFFVRRMDDVYLKWSASSGS